MKVTKDKLVGLFVHEAQAAVSRGEVEGITSLVVTVEDGNVVAKAPEDTKPRVELMGVRVVARAREYATDVVCVVVKKGRIVRVEGVA